MQPDPIPSTPGETPDLNDPSRRRGVVAVIFRDKRLLVIRRSQTVTAPETYAFPVEESKRGKRKEKHSCERCKKN